MNFMEDLAFEEQRLQRAEKKNIKLTANQRRLVESYAKKGQLDTQMCIDWVES